MLKHTLHKALALSLAVCALVATFALPVSAAKNGVTPVVPGMNRTVPGRTESAPPGTPNAQTRRYTPPATNEPTVTPAKIRPVEAPKPETSTTKAE